MSFLPEVDRTLHPRELEPDWLVAGDGVALIEVSLEEFRASFDAEALLTEAELAAARRRPPRVARRFSGARAAQRLVLGRLVGREPRTLEFTRGPHGKPYLPATDRLAFNQADSDDDVLLGVRRLAPGAAPEEAELGVDLEHVRDWPDLEELAASVFTEHENVWRTVGDDTERRRRFFRLWTAKEAFIKATGEGLYRPLLGFRVELDSPAAVHRLTPEGELLGPQIVELETTAERCASACALDGAVRWTRWRLSS